MGLITTEGYRYVLEIARQSVPDGYGNSYFWVKPDRIVPVDRVRRSGPARRHRREVRPFDEDQARSPVGPLVPRPRGRHARGVPAAQLRQRRPRAAHARGPPREHPDAVVSLSSEVLREYREYERTITTLVDASVKPRWPLHPRHRRAAARWGVHRAPGAPASGRRPGHGAQARSAGTAVDIPFYVMKSNGGVISADEVVHQPITTVLSGPAAGALGAALVAGEAGYDRILTCDGAAPRPTCRSCSAASRRSPPRARSAASRPRSR
jgi:N-methylhydantoinase A